jgi:hypothetical protein
LDQARHARRGAHDEFSRPIDLRRDSALARELRRVQRDHRQRVAKIVRDDREQAIARLNRCRSRIVQARDLQGSAHATGQHLGAALVFGTELGRSELVGDVQVAEQLPAPRYRHGDQAAHRAVLRGEASERWMICQARKP